MARFGHNKMTETTVFVEPIVFDIPATAERCCISIVQLHRERKAGRIVSLKIGKRRLFRASDIDAYLASCVDSTGAA